MRSRTGNVVTVARRNVTLACCLGLIASCGKSADPLEAVARVQALGITGGAIPIPVDAKGEASWDGSYAELLAADAFAGCYGRLPAIPVSDVTSAIESGHLRSLFGYMAQPNGVSDPMVDTFLAGLANKMAMSLVACPYTTDALAPNGSNPVALYDGRNAYDQVLADWVAFRRNKRLNTANPTQEDAFTGSAGLNADGVGYCNVNAADATQGELKLSDETAAEVPDLSQYAILSGLSLTTGTQQERALLRVQSEVGYAHLNLCMVERLRGHLNSEQIAFASVENLSQLQAIVRERALASVQQLTMLAHAIDQWESLDVSGFALDSEHYIAPVISVWAQAMPQSDAMADPPVVGTREQLGNDLSLAVTRLIEASTQQMEMLVRTGAAQGTMGSYDGGVVQGPRIDALRAMFGSRTDQEPGVATTDMSAPQVAVLLALARQYDVAALLPSQTVANAVDIEASAYNLRWQVEFRVLAEACQLDSSIYASCVGMDASKGEALRAQFQIELSHVRTLVAALAEMAFGQPETRGTDGVWVYADDPDLLSLRGRLSGQVTRDLDGVDLSQVLGSSWTAVQRIDVDSDFDIHQLVSMGAARAVAILPASDWDPRMLPESLGFVARGMTAGDWSFDGINAPDQSTGAFGTSSSEARPVPQYGTIPALASVIELGAKVGAASGSEMAEFYEGAQRGIALARSAVGPRVVLLRPQTVFWPGSCDRYYAPPDAAPAACLEEARSFDEQSSPNAPLYQVTVVKDDSDPTSALFHRVENGAESTYVNDALSFSGSPNPNDDSAVKLATTSFSSALAITIALGTTEPDDDEFTFMSIDTSAGQIEGRALTVGGQLGDQLRRLTTHDGSNWSRPAYDAFGLPFDWNPAGDASLHGGAVGEEAYQYFLRVAKDAAQQATGAIEQAFDALKEQARDEFALEQSEERAAELGALEMQSLCGAATSCVLPDVAHFEDSDTWATFTIPSDSCPAAEDSANQGLIEDPCLSLASMFGHALGHPFDGEVPIPVIEPVKGQLDAVNPDFSAYAGGELERAFMAQWSAWKRLGDTMTVAMSAAKAAATDVTVAREEYREAKRGVASAKTRAEARKLALLSQQAISWAEYDKYASNEADLEGAVSEAEASVATECDATYDKSFRKALENRKLLASCESTFGPPPSTDPIEGLQRVATRSAIVELVQGTGSETLLGPNGLLNSITVDGCRKALQRDLNERSVGARDRLRRCEGVGVSLDAAEDRLDNFQSTAAQYRAFLEEAVVGQEKAGALEDTAASMDAWSRVSTALRRQRAAAQRALTGLDESLVAVQAAYRDVLATAVEIKSVVNRSNMAVKKIDLEQRLTAAEIQQRFDLERRYNSYDLWRARALSENARRLAVAARRAIESRFVVDLSKLDVSEPFVEAPSVWADEVYGSDLKPPAAVGRVAGPGGDAPYTSKLLDYVNNLELFVQGYAVARPTSLAKQDTEVVQLPGPATVRQEPSAAGPTRKYVDPASSGWAFYCEKVGTWIPNPNASGFGIANGSLPTACNGEPPTKARLGLWLDPWGRPYGTVNDPPYVMRHNARWGRLAVNLVGAGIRDCSLARDTLACYAEPFIRYNLRQVGPVWVTDYAEQWHALDIPLAVIEGGKALASEEWLDPVSNGFTMPSVSNIARTEYRGRPLGGAYEIVLELTPDVRVERIERIQILAETDYWVRQGSSDTVDEQRIEVQCGNGVVEVGELCELVLGGVAPQAENGADYPVCPWSCDDLDPSTHDFLIGSAQTCNSECQNIPVDLLPQVGYPGPCVSGDGYCPPSCSADLDATNTDGDCLSGVLLSWKSSGSYTSTQTRFVWDPLSGTLRGVPDPITGEIAPFPSDAPPVVLLDGEHYIQIEGTRTNYLPDSRDLAATSWTAQDAVVTSGTAIDGTDSASVVVFGNSGGAVINDLPYGPTGSQQTVFSALARGPTVDASGNWVRSSLLPSPSALPLSQLPLDGAADETTSYDFVQYEIGAFPSSPISTTSAPVTRDANSLVVPAGSLPEVIRTGTWRVRVIPYFASTDVLDSGVDAPVLSLVDAAMTAAVTIALRPSASELRIQFQGGSDIVVSGVSWSRYDELEILVDRYRSRVTFTNLTTPASETVSTFGMPAIDPPWDLAVGHTPTSHSFFGLISEPKGTAPTPGFGATVVNSDPAHQEIGVDPLAAIAVTFDTPIDLLSIDESSLTLRDPAGVDVPYTVAAGATANDVLLVPESSLSLLTRYTVHVTDAVVDTSGGSAADVQFDFLTRDGVWAMEEHHVVSGAGVYVRSTAVDHDANGNAVVAWIVAPSSVYMMEFDRSTEEFSDPVLINSPGAGDDVQSIVVDVSPNGRAIVVSSVASSSGTLRQTARRDVSGAWTTDAAVVSWVCCSNWGGSGAINEAGDALASVAAGASYRASASTQWGSVTSLSYYQTSLGVLVDNTGVFHALGINSSGVMTRWRLDPAVGTWAAASTYSTTLTQSPPVALVATSNLIATARVAATNAVVALESTSAGWTETAIGMSTGNAASNIVANERGDALAFWTTTANANHRALRPAGQGWDQSQAYSVHAGSDQAACGGLDGRGNALVLFESGSVAQEAHRYSADDEAWLTPQVAGTAPESNLGDIFGRIVYPCKMSVDPWGRALVAYSGGTGKALRTLRFE